MGLLRKGETLDLQGAIRQAWTRLCERVEVTRDLEFDHEFTLQFHLAWEVARILGFPDNLGVRFEVPCGRDSDGQAIRLDLLLWTDPEAKVAVEIKAPVRSESGKNSAMTQFRMRFYLDLHRLRYLVETRCHGITSGCFLAVVNEKGYVVERRQRMNLGYRTYHGEVVKAGSEIAPDAGPNGHKFPLKMPMHEIKFEWECDVDRGDVRPIRGMRHYWLRPILVLPGRLDLTVEVE